MPVILIDTPNNSDQQQCSAISILLQICIVSPLSFNYSREFNYTNTHLTVISVSIFFFEYMFIGNLYTLWNAYSSVQLIWW